MRGFVALLLVLCIGSGAVLEWVRASHERGPFLVDSRQIDWRRVSANYVPAPPPNVQTEGTLADRIATLRAITREARFWAEKMFEIERNMFEPVHCRGAVIRIDDTPITSRIVVQISRWHAVNDQWNFCAQADGYEYFCRVERRRANTLFGVILERTKLRATPRAGVLLLRPIHLRPTVHAQAKPSRQELAALNEHHAWLVHATQSMTRTVCPPDTEATVLETRGHIVILSLGKSDGVTVGCDFKVSRGRQFVGFVRITRVLENSAVGEFDSQFTGKGAPPRIGDRAYNR